MRIVLLVAVLMVILSPCNLRAQSIHEHYPIGELVSQSPALYFIERYGAGDTKVLYRRYPCISQNLDMSGVCYELHWLPSGRIGQSFLINGVVMFIAFKEDGSWRFVWVAGTST